LLGQHETRVRKKQLFKNLLTKDNFQTSKAWANIAVRQVLGLL